MGGIINSQAAARKTSIYLLFLNHVIHILSYIQNYFHRHYDGGFPFQDSLFFSNTGIITMSEFRKEEFPVGGNYQKSTYNQLMEVMAKLDAMDAEHKKDRKEIKSLTAEVTSLRKENDRLRGEVSALKQENSALKENSEKLGRENALLRDDNERLKRNANNNSSNSSNPPSKDQNRPPKAPNTYNGRKPTRKKPGAQPGHKGHGLSRADVEEKIRKGLFMHRFEEIGSPGRPYITRYRLDLDIRTTATEIRIHADDNGKFQVPAELKAEVSYGEKTKAITAFLYSEGVVANDRICTFINSISGDSLGISTGSVYGFCRKFSAACTAVCGMIEEKLLDAHEICTDATPVRVNGKQTFIRNFSTEKNVLYFGCDKKDLETLENIRIFKEFAGVFTHDHETAIYHFGTGHGECNVHMERYLLKNTEETGNVWSRQMSSFLKGMNQGRKELKLAGESRFAKEQLERYAARYDEIIARGMEQNKNTKGRVAKKEEKALLNRLKKYKENHLLFLYDFEIHFSNNISEKDLRICKNRQKMAGGFRTADGRRMYCEIMSFIETVKRRGLNIFQSIINLMNGTPVIQ